MLSETGCWRSFLITNMKISLDKKYKDGYGRAVRILEINGGDDDEYPVQGELLVPGNRNWLRRSWTADGRWWNDGEPRKDDLVEVVESPEPEPKAPAPVATAPQWQTGAARTLDGTDAWIFFVQPESKHQRYIGKAKDSDGEWRALHWCDSGRVPYTTTGHAKNLAPPPKKTVRVRCWLNVDACGSVGLFDSREDADSLSSFNRIACIEIDREVTEGEGL